METLDIRFIKKATFRFWWPMDSNYKNCCITVCRYSKVFKRLELPRDFLAPIDIRENSSYSTASPIRSSGVDELEVKMCSLNERNYTISYDLFVSDLTFDKAVFIS